MEQVIIYPVDNQAFCNLQCNNFCTKIHIAENQVHNKDVTNPFKIVIVSERWKCKFIQQIKESNHHENFQNSNVTLNNAKSASTWYWNSTNGSHILGVWKNGETNERQSMDSTAVQNNHHKLNQKIHKKLAWQAGAPSWSGHWPGPRGRNMSVCGVFSGCSSGDCGGVWYDGRSESTTVSSEPPPSSGGRPPAPSTKHFVTSTAKQAQAMYLFPPPVIDQRFCNTCLFYMFNFFLLYGNNHLLFTISNSNHAVLCVCACVSFRCFVFQTIWVQIKKYLWWFWFEVK